MTSPDAGRGPGAVSQFRRISSAARRRWRAAGHRAATIATEMSCEVLEPEEPAAVVAPERLHRGPQHRVRPEEEQEHLPVVALARRHHGVGDGGDGEAPTDS